MGQDKFTEQEYQTLKNDINSIGSHLPTHLQSPIWNYYTKIEGRNERQPCGCPSAAGLWNKAITRIKEYISQHG